MELYPGGRLELILRGCLNGSRRWGTFREVHAPHHLAFTWTSDGLGLGGQETRVTVDISGGDDGSTLTLVQEGLPDESTLETNRRAWEELLESLEGLLANP